MLFVERAPSPCFDEGDLSKDFGLDITVSDGGLVTSAANQRQYQAECSRIYQQFILNMTDYISEEAQLRKTLTSLQSQQKKPPGEKAKPRRTETPKTPELFDEDAFSTAQLEEFKSILGRENCRSKLSQASGFAAVDGPPDGANRAQTPKVVQRSMSSLANQPPVRHMFPALKERPPSVKASQLRRDSKSTINNDVERRSSLRGNAFGATATNNEYDGIMESNAEFSSNRRIRMNPRAFTKLMTGQVRVKLLNKTGEFELTPVSSDAAVLAAEETEKQAMDNKEKIALVKQKTTFKSPTLSSDLKISNLVAIQKALKGQSAKRITVGEVMKSARDRKARLFRVQVTGNRFDEFDQKEEDIGYVHEIKAANDLGDEMDARPTSRMRFSPHINMLRQSETRPESRLRSPTPIPLHILDPHAAQSLHPYHPRSETPGMVTQVSLDFSGLTVHKDCSDFEHRYTQAVDLDKFKERSSKPLSVIQLDFDESDSKSKPVGGQASLLNRGMAVPGMPSDSRALHTPSQHSGVFPVSKVKRGIFCKSAAPGRESTAKKRVEIQGVTPMTPKTSRNLSPHNLPECPVKRISTMRDTACIVKRWQEEDKSREEKLNRWRMRMSFAATRRGNLAKVLTRAKSGR